MKAEELIGLEKDLYPILENNSLTREDDMKLYMAYLLRCFIKNKHDWDKTFGDFVFLIFENPKERNKLKVKPFCTVERCRRKLQEKYPELRGKNYRPRNKEQETYKEYVKESCHFKVTSEDTDENRL